jgi:3-mercaptopyruvate sulfurtransferase SseA
MTADKRRYIFLWMLISGGVFVIIAALALAVLNRIPSTEATPTPASAAQVKRVSLADAKAAFDHGTAVFVDVRDSASYQSSHIPEALSIPLSDLTSHLDELDPSSWIITYCT